MYITVAARTETLCIYMFFSINRILMMLEGWFFIVSLSIPVIRRVSSSLQSKYALLYSWFALQLEDAKPKGTVASLDGVRAIACLSVVVFHTHIATEKMNLWQGADQPLLTSLFWSGASGVTLFFVLSGFCLRNPGRTRDCFICGVSCGSSQAITFRSSYSLYCPVRVLCNHRIGSTCCSFPFFSWTPLQPPIRPSMVHTGRWLWNGNSTCSCQ